MAPLAVFWLANAVPSPLSAQVNAPANSASALRELAHYEPTGLSLLQPYVRGKVPVVFVHGLWASPWSWSRMIKALEAEPALKGSFQFWTYGYSTGDPIPFTAYLLRRDLDEVRRKLDPSKADPAFDRMVIIGHSMGGLLTKMIAAESGDRLWRVVSDHPFAELMGEEDDRKLFRSGLFFGASGGPPRGLYRNAASRQPVRPGLDPAGRDAVDSHARPAAPPTIGWWHRTRRTFSGNTFGRVCPAVSTSWSGAHPS